MSLEQAILGFLSYRPMTGYDLKKIFDTSVQHFWPANQSQIYRTLARLAENDLVEMERVEQADRPDRKVYHITSDGSEALYEWLSVPQPFGHGRSAPLVQVFFAGQLPDEHVIKIFENAANFVRAGLERLDQIPEDLEAYSDYIHSPREFAFWMLTLEQGKVEHNARLEWIKSVLERLQNGEFPQE